MITRDSSTSTLLELLDNFEPAEVILAKYGFTSEAYKGTPSLPSGANLDYFSLKDCGIDLKNIDIVDDDGLEKIGRAHV